MLEILSGVINIIGTIIGGIINEISYAFEDFGVDKFGLAQIYESSPAPDFIRFLKITSYILTPIFLFLIIWIIRSFVNLMKSQPEFIAEDSGISEAPAPGGALQARWEEILKHIESTREAEWKFAVIEADKLVDDLLKSSGFPGETMGERLMNIDKTQLITLDSLWDAHKTRNRLVHDTNYFLRYAEAKRAVSLYEETLKELGGL